MLIGLATNGVAVILLSIVFSVGEWLDHRGQAVTTLAVHAGVIADNVAPALVFGDEKSAGEVLERLGKEPTLVHAELRDMAGAVVARFNRAGRYKPPPALPAPDGHLFFADRLEYAKSVAHLGEPVGILTLQSDLSPVYVEMLRKLLLIVIAMAASLTSAVFLFARFQKSISDPIRDLAAAMTRVTRQSDYSTHVPVQGRDEIGALAENFNAMIAAVREREAALVEHREGLENTVRQRTEELNALNESLTHQVLEMQLAETVFNASSNAIIITNAENRIVAVNAAFCKITGYSEAEVVGQAPSILSSGRHDAGFYRAMWQTLLETGRWDGEIWNRRKNGDPYAEWLTINTVKNSRGENTHFVAIFSDITQRKAAEDEIRHLAFYDPLTRLPNRRLLLDRLGQAMASSVRSGRQGALLFIDLDNFKMLNDTLGHDMGDRLLQQVADRLVGCVREGDSVARLGGDEFVVMLEDLSGNSDEAAAQAETVGEKILATLNRTYELSGREYHGTPSIGIALFGKQRQSMDDLLKHADLAMYQAKAAGRNALRFFDPRMQAAVTARSRMEAGLRQALREEHFLLFYQPQIDGTGRMAGAEALIRWRHPVHGLVMPDRFIPIAEESGLIVPIGEWVLREVCRQVRAWRTAGLPPFFIAVNLSARQFAQERLAERICGILAEMDVEPAAIELEITESTVMDRADNAAAVLRDLHERGFRIAIDDFGTGYSSLGYLKRFPVDKLKIDRSFVMDIPGDANDAAIASAIIQMAKILGLEVVAEGVETDAQHEFLRTQGCAFQQGFRYSRPLDVAAFESFLRANAAQPPAAS
ncbi:MAG: EAL domain-containing protein [Candidatus Nitricoxidivorans perseverans]|uniref:EAL domain-containing protein n=1 Tax=Candidatus Nitricoxidivorans perseverans TaxID=2975601 RepID=A0AA49FJL2_9PROT|nr:MAG: EAL domain-containing protein [Candidatus Nitricoxidivorans perseverans]